MKKLIFLALLFCSFIACKNDKSETKEVKATSTDTTASVEIRTPKEMVDDYISAYDAYFAEYKAAVKNDDAVKINELGKIAKELYIEGEETMRNASGDELARLKKYMDDRTNEILEMPSR